MSGLTQPIGMTPRDAYDAFREGNGEPQLLQIARLIGTTRPKLYGWLEPSKYPRHRPLDEDFGAIAAFLNVKVGTRFTAHDIRQDYVARGGCVEDRRRRRRDS